MRSSSTGPGLSTTLEAWTRRPDSPVRIIPIALTVEKNTDGSLRQHIRQRKDQWEEADSTTGLSLLDEGDVRLTDTIVTHVSSTTHPDTFTDLNRTSPWDVLLIEWGGAEDYRFELQRLKLWLAPRNNAAQTQEVAQWKVELMGVTEVLSFKGEDSAVTSQLLTLVKLCDAVTQDVTGESAGEVTFDFSTLASRPQPKGVGIPRKKRQGDSPDAPSTIYNSPVTLVFVYALKADGSAAGNVGLGYDAGVASAGTGTVVRGRHLTLGAGDIPDNWLLGRHVDDGDADGTPHVVVETGTYTSDEIVFSSGNLFDLGGAPSGDVQLVLRGSVPNGCALTGQVRNDADSDWVTFTDGQWMIADLALVPSQTRKMRCDLVTNAAGNLTPTLTGLGMAAYSETNFDRQVTVTGGNWSIDPKTLKGEIPEITITAIRDGERDYHDAVSDLLAGNHIGNIVWRLYWGHPSITRKDWQHVDDFLIDGVHPHGASIAIKCLSVLSLLRDMVPRYEPGEVTAPNGDSSVGAWEDEGGATTNLYQSVDETSFDDTDYIRSEANPTNSAVILDFGTPVDPVGRRHILDYRYQKDSTDTMDLTVEYRDGTTVIASTSHTDIPAEPTAASFSLTDEQVAELTGYTNIRVRFVANKTAGAGSTRVRVTWVRLRFGGKRDQIAYSNSSLKDTSDDLMQNHLALDARYQGPGIADDATLVTKTLTDPSDRGKPTSKRELDALAHIAGGGYISSQGRIKFVEMYGQRAIRAIFPSEEIKMEEASPGFEERVPEYFVRYQWNEAHGEYGAELKVFHAGALLNLGKDHLNAPELDEVVCKWIPSETLASTVGTRHVTAIGPGLIEWRFVSNYPYPELEPGDLVLVQTDQFVARDPNASRELRGVLWADAVVRSVDVSARRFTVWVRNYADIVEDADPVVLAKQATESVLSFSRARPFTVGEDWDFIGETYAVPPVADGSDHEGIIAVTPVELPNGATVRSFAARVYVDSQSAGSAQFLSQFWAAANDGSASVEVGAVNTTDGAGSDGVWQTLERATAHVVDWSTYHYYTETALRATGVAANMRFMWNRVDYD